MSNPQELALVAADVYFFNAPKTLAVIFSTVEAESNWRNITGDGGSALGFGQVWMKWHRDKLINAAGKLGLELTGNDTADVLGNDELSMFLAVGTIKSFWQAAGGNYTVYVKKYVGPN